VTVGDTTLIFSGVTQRDDGAYLSFEVQAGNLESGQLTVGQTIVPLVGVDGRYEAGPIDPAAVADPPGGIVTLVIGETLIPFTVAEDQTR
jgi:hypothetical protein